MKPRTELAARVDSDHRLTPFFVCVAVLALGCTLLERPYQSPPPLAGRADTFQTMCNWPAGTVMAFAGWATMAELGLTDGTGHPGPDDLVYAVVSRDRISQYKNLGPPVVARGICWTDGNVVGMSGVPDDWVLNRKP
jgi:hypothetical protein